MTDLTSRLVERYQRADERNLDIEGASKGRADTVWWREQHRSMAAAHRELAEWHTAKEMALAPTPDAPWVYPPAGEDRW